MIGFLDRGGFYISAVLYFIATENMIRMSLAVDVGTPSAAFAMISACAMVYYWDDQRNHFLLISGFSGAASATPYKQLYPKCSETSAHLCPSFRAGTLPIES